MRDPFGWDLPPGCSQRDIDEAFGADEPEKYRHEPDDDPYCQECLEPLRHCECAFTYGEKEDKAIVLYPELPFPEDEGDYDEEPF